MRNRPQVHLSSDEGSSLVSTLLLLVFLSVIITSVTGAVKHQIHQYKQTAYSYESNTLIEMTEVILRETENPDEHFPRKIVFSTGEVRVSRKAVNLFQLEAVLHNQYTSKKQVLHLNASAQDVADDGDNIQEDRPAEVETQDILDEKGKDKPNGEALDKIE